jgi:hypothetical protein
MAFLSEMGQAAIKPATGSYLNINKMKQGESVQLRLVDPKPVEGFEIWGTAGSSSAGQASKPFRFDHDPTPEDIDAAFGADYVRAINTNTNAIEVPKYFMALAFYDLETAEIRAAIFTQKTVQRRFNEIDSFKGVNITDLLLVISPADKAYNVTSYPLEAQAKKDSDAAWKEALDNGFDLRRLFEGGNPFKAG